jgi:hypothetical protein
MDRKLNFLDSFHAHGSDGATYKVMAYEHLRHDDSVPDDALGQHWVPTGVHEYRLASGELVEPAAGGALRVVRSGVALQRE